MNNLFTIVNRQIRAVRTLTLCALHESRLRQGTKLLAHDLRHLIDQPEIRSFRHALEGSVPGPHEHPPSNQRRLIAGPS